MRSGWEPWRPGGGGALPGLPRVVAHRGASAEAPENTLAAFRRAHALGARWVELDARLARDGLVVVLHDSTLERTTDGRGRVRELDAAGIARLDAGSWFAPRFAGERLPSLEAALALLAELGMGVNVELKAEPGQERRTGVEVAALIRRVWPDPGPPLLLSSFAQAALAAAMEAAPELPRGLLREAAGTDWAPALQRLACTSLHLGARHLQPGQLEALARSGVPVLVYTVNDPQQARRLLAGGARAVFSDVPDRILAGLGEDAAPPQ